MPGWITPRLLVMLILTGVSAMLLALLVTPLAAASATRCGALAVPRSRDVHDRPIPRWGGLAIFAAFLAPVGLVVLVLGSRVKTDTLWQGAGIILGGALITWVGALDDRRELSPLPRLGAQAGAALLAFLMGVRIDVLKVPLIHHPINTHWFSAPITLFWMMLMMNAINWLDGLDGLAAGVCAIIALFMAFMALATHQVCLALLCVALAGSTLGFLRYNYSPARIYMGGGAEFVGFVLAAVAVAGAFKQVATVAVVPPLIAMAVPILDSVHVVLRRAASGEPVYQADNRHFHHKLLNWGLTKQQAVLVFYLLTAALCGGAWLLFHAVAAHRVVGHQPHRAGPGSYASRSLAPAGAPRSGSRGS